MEQSRYRESKGERSRIRLHPAPTPRSLQTSRDSRILVPLPLRRHAKADAFQSLRPFCVGNHAHQSGIGTMMCRCKPEALIQSASPDVKSHMP